MPVWAYAMMVAGGIWLCLWNSRVRLLGVAPFDLPNNSSSIESIVSAVAPGTI